MRLATLDDLPQQVSDGPESWGEAFGKFANAINEFGMLSNDSYSMADRNTRQSIYDERIKTIRDLTGEQLQNPIRSDLPIIGEIVPDFMQPSARIAYTPLENQFDEQVQNLTEQYPQLNSAFRETVDQQQNRMLLEAKKRSEIAGLSPELGPVGATLAELYGGLKTAVRDPFQWQAAILGGGAAKGASVAARIGKTMLVEALMNGGQEAVLQAASQEQKRKAGLEYGMESALKNIGVSAVFGSLFGGTVQGAGELARLYKMGKGGEEIAARVLDGAPQRGDVEALAKAMNVELSPDKLDMLNRSFEDKVLDDVMISQDAPPEQHRVLDAAMRYADDPDNHPPPELVERMIADEQSGPLRTLSADQYERAYGGDANAIDDIRDTFFADNVSRLETRVDEIAARTVDAVPPMGEAVAREVPNPRANAVQPEISVEQQVVKPAQYAEPATPGAMKIAEGQAGEIVPPRVDANGNPENVLDYLPFEDGDGNRSWISTKEALDLAAEPHVLADIMETCNL